MAANRPIPRLARLATTFGSTPQLLTSPRPSIPLPPAPVAPQGDPNAPVQGGTITPPEAAGQFQGAPPQGAYGNFTGPAISNYDPMEGLPMDADPEAIRANAKVQLAEALPNWQQDPLQAEMYAAGAANIDYQVDQMAAADASGGGGGGGGGGFGGGGGYGGGGGGGSDEDVLPAGVASDIAKRNSLMSIDQRDIARAQVAGGSNARQNAIIELLYGDSDLGPSEGLIQGHLSRDLLNTGDIESRFRKNTGAIQEAARMARKKGQKSFIYGGEVYNAKHPLGFAPKDLADELFNSKHGLKGQVYNAVKREADIVAVEDKLYGQGYEVEPRHNPRGPGAKRDSSRNLEKFAAAVSRANAEKAARTSKGKGGRPTRTGGQAAQAYGGQSTKRTTSAGKKAAKRAPKRQAPKKKRGKK